MLVIFFGLLEFETEDEEDEREDDTDTKTGSPDHSVISSRRGNNNYASVSD